MTHTEYVELKEKFQSEYQSKLQALELIYKSSGGITEKVAKIVAPPSAVRASARRSIAKKAHKKTHTMNWRQYDKPVRELVLDAIAELKEPFTAHRIADILKVKFPQQRERFSQSTVGATISYLLTQNQVRKSNTEVTPYEYMAT